MTEWGVVLILITLLGFITGIVTPLLRLNTAIVRLIDAVETLDKSMQNLNENNTKTHKRIFERLDEHDDILNKHSTQFVLIEEKMKER